MNRRNLPAYSPSRPADDVAVYIQDQREPLAPPQQLQAPEDVPNVLIVLIDDMGFGAQSAFGGPCEMPWDELDETQRAVAARLMENYAAFAGHTDTQVGRLIDYPQGEGNPFTSRVSSLTITRADDTVPVPAREAADEILATQ